MQAAPQVALTKSAGRGAQSRKGILGPFGKNAGRALAFGRKAGAPQGVASALAAAPARKSTGLAKAPVQLPRGEDSFSSLLQRLSKRGTEGRAAKESLGRPEAAQLTSKKQAMGASGRRRPARASATEDERALSAGMTASEGASAAAAVTSSSAQASLPKAAAKPAKSPAEARERLARAPGAVTVAEGAATRPRMVVVDLRTPEATDATQARAKGAARKARSAESSGAEKASAVRGELTVVSARSAEQLRDGSPLAQRSSGEKPGEATLSAAKASASPQTRFSEVLRDEVVRHASVVVRDGGDGEIRLHLKPDSLGEVRIRMKVVDDSIEGRIVVQNAEARELFQENLGTLEAALREQGFLSARLDVAVSDGGRDRPQAQGSPAGVRAVATEELDRSGKVVYLTDAGTHAVDLVV